MLKVCFVTESFHPHIGGIERVTELLALGLTQRGFDVSVITNTRAEASSEGAFSFQILRAPRLCARISGLRAANVVIVQSMCLGLAWPLAVIKKPTLLVKHGPDLPSRFHRRPLETRIEEMAKVLCVSRFVGTHQSRPWELIHNPFDDHIFCPGNESARVDMGILFVGRLVENKGVFLLLNVLRELATMGIIASLTIVGSGAAQDRVVARVRAWNLQQQVRFLGELPPAAVAEQFRRHKVAVFPSQCEEAFGLVALEAAACGCVPICTDVGGFREAVGPCGVVVPRDDVHCIAKTVAELFSNAELRKRYTDAAGTHLEPFRAQNVTIEYSYHINQLAR